MYIVICPLNNSLVSSKFLQNRTNVHPKQNKHRKPSNSQPPLTTTIKRIVQTGPHDFLDWSGVCPTNEASRFDGFCRRSTYHCYCPDIIVAFTLELPYLKIGWFNIRRNKCFVGPETSMSPRGKAQGPTFFERGLFFSQIGQLSDRGKEQSSREKGRGRELFNGGYTCFMPYRYIFSTSQTSWP